MVGGKILEMFSVLGGDDSKLSPVGDVDRQLRCERSSVRRKIAYHIGDNIILSPGGAVLVTSP